jgi:hypothetical protein
MYGGWRYNSTILDLGARWRWAVSFTSPPLYPRGKDPGYPLDRRMGGPQNRSGSCRVQKNLLPYRESNPGRPASSYTDWAIPAPLWVRLHHYWLRGTWLWLIPRGFAQAVTLRRTLWRNVSGPALRSGFWSYFNSVKSHGLVAFVESVMAG